MDATDDKPLNIREQQMAMMLAMGVSQKEIAARMRMTTRAIRYIASGHRKPQVRKRVEQLCRRFEVVTDDRIELGSAACPVGHD